MNARTHQTYVQLQVKRNVRAIVIENIGTLRRSTGRLRKLLANSDSKEF